MRARILAAAGLVVCLLLTGCDPQMFQGPIAVKSSGDDFSVAVCVSGVAEQVIAAERGADRRWRDFWVAESEIALSSGEIFVNGGSNGGAAIGDYSRPNLKPGSELDIDFFDSEGSVASAVLVVPMTGMPSNGWLQSDGTVTKEPCPVR